jgi:type VI secretion system secreted protein Hcp
MKIVKNAVLLSLVVGTAAVAADANAALNAYVTFQGKKQGPFKGDFSIQKNAKTNESIVFGIDLDTQAPFDLATGQASGKRQHSPLVLVKPINGASPQIYRALVSNEELTEVVVDLRAPTNPTGLGGAVATVLKYTLTNARITDVHHSMTTPCVGSAPCRATGPDGNIVGPDEPTETISLVFGQIEIDYTDHRGTTSVKDDLEQPVVAVE